MKVIMLGVAIFLQSEDCKKRRKKRKLNACWPIELKKNCYIYLVEDNNKICIIILSSK